MAALNRPTEATYAVHENVTVDTADHEDHTFCGVMFPVKCKDLLPLDHVVIHSVAVRGRLGPLTVWVSNEEPNNNNNNSFRLSPRFWTKVYEKTHTASFRSYRELDFRDNPVVLRPGQVRAIYVHSTLPGDEAIVYDNRHSRRTYDDALLSILPGRAHVSETPFGNNPIWGWGNAWRDHREFVGRIEFGAVYKLWNPTMSVNFGSKFQNLVRALFMCQRRWESPVSMLPDDCIFYILNMCRWDWANDTQTQMKELRRRRRARELAAVEQIIAEAQQEPEQAAEGVARAAASSVEAPSDAVESSSGCCPRSCQQQDEEEEEEGENFPDEEEEGDFPDSDDEELVDSEAGDGDDNEDDLPDEIDYEEMEDDDEDFVDEDDDDDESDLDDDSDYLADNNVFVFRDDDSDEEQDQNEGAVQERNRRAWIRRQFARIHVLRALASLDDNAVVEVDFHDR